MARRADAVRARTSFWQTQRMVIDPSLFTTPVSFATWKGVQGDPAATLTDTVADQFWHGGGKTRPTPPRTRSSCSTAWHC